MDQKKDTTTLPSKNELRWACRRGMLELDLVFQRFLETSYDQLNLDEQKNFVDLLALSDQTLYDWILKRNAGASQNFSGIIDKLLLST